MSNWKAKAAIGEVLDKHNVKVQHDVGVAGKFGEDTAIEQAYDELIEDLFRAFLPFVDELTPKGR